MDGAFSMRERIYMHIKCWLGSLKEGDHMEDLGVDGKIALKWILMKSYWRM